MSVSSNFARRRPTTASDRARLALGYASHIRTTTSWSSSLGDTVSKLSLDSSRRLRYTLEMTECWTDEKVLYFHFLTANGSAASLPMTRTLRAFSKEFKGIPGTKQVNTPAVGGGTKLVWLVPGFTCINCGKTFFSPDKDGLKHGCTNNGGIISGRA